MSSVYNEFELLMGDASKISSLVGMLIWSSPEQVWKDLGSFYFSFSGS